MSGVSNVQGKNRSILLIEKRIKKWKSRKDKEEDRK